MNGGALELSVFTCGFKKHFDFSLTNSRRSCRISELVIYYGRLHLKGLVNADTASETVTVYEFRG